MNDFLTKFSGDRGVRLGVVSVLSVLTLFLLVTTYGEFMSGGRSGVPATDTITVTGDGQATVAPDVARISFTVQNTAATVSEAQAATTKQSNAAIEYVKGKGLAEKDIKTLSYSISPQYSYPNPCAPGMACPAYGGTPKITGYLVSTTVQVTVRDLASVGDLLSGLGKLEVQNISGPDFALDDATAGYSAAREDAIREAKDEARVLAKQLGVRLGKVVNFSESSGGATFPVMYSMGAARDMKAESAPTIPVGENTYNASVSITYEIR